MTLCRWVLLLILTRGREFSGERWKDVGLQRVQARIGAVLG
jgi:hypothetical protein